MVSTSQSAALVGRDEQLTRLDELVAEVAAGRGRAVWVEGEPGIGKSALLEAALAGVEQAGCQLFRAAAHELSQRFPLRVLLECLQVSDESQDRERADIAALLCGAGAGVAGSDPVAPASERLLALVDQLCAAAPVVLVVDDLQWADEASLAVWDRLVRSVGQLPLLLIAASRSVARHKQLAAVRRGLRAGGGVQFGLEPLTSEQSAGLVARLLGAAPGPGLRQLAAQAGGNPLYLRELVDALVREDQAAIRNGVAEVATGDVRPPTSLSAAIADRLEFLSAETIETLQMAALLGPEFTVSDLGTITQRGPLELVKAVDEGLSTGVLSQAGVHLVFRHALIRQALSEAIPAGLRSALHLQAAQALIATGTSMERVAEQLLAGTDAFGMSEGWVLDWLAEAGPRLVYRAPRTAVELADRALGGLPTDDPRWENLSQLLITAAWLDGQDGEVERRARQILAHTKDPARAAQVAWTLSYVLGRASQMEAATAVCTDAMSDPGIDSLWSARLRALQALHLVQPDRYEEAEAPARAALAQAERLGDCVGAGYALHALALAREANHDNAGCLAYIERGLAVVGEHPETTDLRLLLFLNRAMTLQDLDRLSEALSASQEATRAVELGGSRTRLQAERVTHAQILFLAGQWDEALVELESADSGYSGNAALRLIAAGLRALIAAHRDDHVAADRALRSVAGEDLSQGGKATYTRYLRRARALVAERDGNYRLALAEQSSLMKKDADLEIHGRPWLAAVARLALTTGDVDTARTVVSTTATNAEQEPLPSLIATAEHCQGLLDGDPEPLLAAAERYRSTGRVLELANTLEDAAVLLADQGDHDEARAALDEALDHYGDLRADYDMRRASARLRPLGLRRGQRGPRRRPTTGWGALTPTELRVAALVAEGRSNPDIAAVMFLSRRTVQTHVSHILAKLGARSRVDIAIHANQHDRHQHDASSPLAAAD